jgi:hypothetical protein
MPKRAADTYLTDRNYETIMNYHDTLDKRESSMTAADAKKVSRTYFCGKRRCTHLALEYRF